MVQIPDTRIAAKPENQKKSKKILDEIWHIAGPSGTDDHPRIKK
jgi:hypothetical protein